MSWIFGGFLTTLSRSMVLVVMGVAGSGKTTVATLLAKRLGWPLQEGDALHPQSNIEKMQAGHPLTDDDRSVWLTRVADWVDDRLDKGKSGVITCSALKHSYRELINRRGSDVVFVYLAGARETIRARLAERRGHFMPPSLLDSQLADLEEPSPGEPAVRVDVGPPPDLIAQQVIDSLGLAT